MNLNWIAALAVLVLLEKVVPGRWVSSCLGRRAGRLGSLRAAHRAAARIVMSNEAEPTRRR